MTADIRITDSKRRRNHGNSTMQSLFGGGRDRKLFQSGGSPQLHAVRREPAGDGAGEGAGLSGIPAEYKGRDADGKR